MRPSGPLLLVITWPLKFLVYKRSFGGFIKLSSNEGQYLLINAVALFIAVYNNQYLI